MTIEHASQGIRDLVEDERERIDIADCRLLVDALLRATARLPHTEIDGVMRRLQVVDAALAHVEVLATLGRTPQQMADACATFRQAVAQLALVAGG